MAINVENYFEQKLKFDQITNPGKTLEQVKADFQKAGVSAEEHYKKWGWAELLSLDTDFDVAQYLADKAALDGKTVDQVIADFKKAGVNPQEHYENWGKGEGLTPVAVGATPGEGEEPGTPNTLTEALAALQEATAAETDALVAVAVAVNAASETPLTGDDLEGFVEAFTSADAETAVQDAQDAIVAQQAVVDAAVAAVSSARNTTLSSYVNADDSALQTAVRALDGVGDIKDAKLTDSYINTIVSETLKQVRADSASKTAFDELNSAKSKLASHESKKGTDKELAKNVSDAIIAYLAGGGVDNAGALAGVVGDYEAESIKSSPAWDTLLDTLVALFDSASLALEPAQVKIEGTSDVELATASASLISALKVAVITANERLTLKDAVDTKESDFEATTAGPDYLAALALKAERDADVKEISTEKDKLVKAEDAAEGLQALVKEYTEASKLTEAAEKALADLGVENLVSLSNPTEFGAADEADLYLFVEGNDVTLSNFEDADMLFIGEGFVRVDLDEDFVFGKKAAGDVAVLEVFFHQAGNDVVVTIENAAFGGNASGTSDIDQITIVGVNLADVTFDKGFITVAA